MKKQTAMLSRPVRFTCLILAPLILIALLASGFEEPNPWKFQITGSCFLVLFGYLGITGKTPDGLNK